MVRRAASEELNICSLYATFCLHALPSDIEIARCDSSKLASDELSSQVHGSRIARILQVLSIDTTSIGGIADTISLFNTSVQISKDPMMPSNTHQNADVQGLRDPVGRDARREPGRKTIDVSGRGTSIVINIAGQSSPVQWVADEEDALDSIKGSARESWHGVDGGCGSLRVAF